MLDPGSIDLEEQILQAEGGRGQIPLARGYTWASVHC